MQIKKLVLLTLSATLIVSSTGCNKTKLPDEKVTTVDDSDKQSSEEDDKNDTKSVPSEEELKQQETEKYNAYIKANNFMTDRLQTVINGYFDRVKEQEKFEMNNTDDYWCNSLGDSYYEIIDAANEYVEKEPSFGKLDTAYQKMYPVLSKMMKAFDEVYEYGELKTYLDDDYAGAKKLHAKVWKQYKKFLKLSDSFFDEMTKLSEKQRKETMKELKEKGYEVQYSLIETIAAGQEIQQFFIDNKIDDSNLTETNIKELEPLYKKFVKVATKAYNNLNDKEKMKKEKISSIGSMVDSALKDAKVSMTELYSRIKEKKPVDYSELTIPDDDTISGFSVKLGDLISNYNNMQTYQ